MKQSLLDALAAGEWSKAEPLLRREAARAAAPAEVHYNHGKVLLELRKPSQAVTAFRKALRKKPAYPAAWFELGRAALSDGDFELAEAAFTRAAKLDPGDGDARINGAKAAVRRGSWSTALALLDGVSGGEAEILRYRALAETGSPESDAAMAAMLAQTDLRPSALTAITRVAKGRMPLRPPTAP